MEKNVQEILAPFMHEIADKRSSYDTVMRGIVSSNPELRENIALYDAVASAVQEKMQTFASDYHRQAIVGTIRTK